MFGDDELLGSDKTSTTSNLSNQNYLSNQDLSNFVEHVGLAPLQSATQFALKNNRRTRAFLRNWLRLASDPALIPSAQGSLLGDQR